MLLVQLNHNIEWFLRSDLIRIRQHSEHKILQASVQLIMFSLEIQPIVDTEQEKDEHNLHR